MAEEKRPPRYIVAEVDEQTGHWVPLVDGAGHPRVYEGHSWGEAVDAAAKDGEADGLPRSGSFVAIPAGYVHGRTYEKATRPTVRSRELELFGATERIPAPLPATEEGAAGSEPPVGPPTGEET